jgi:DNA-binding NarL/FixJ family response regulator
MVGHKLGTMRLARIVPSPPCWNNALVSGRRVLIVDDHAGFRSSARTLLETEGCHVVGCAADGDEALRMVVSVPADVVLVDLYLPGSDGISIAERIANLKSPPPVILISSHDEAASEERVRAAPVRGFLAKRDLACAAIDRLLV